MRALAIICTAVLALSACVAITGPIGETDKPEITEIVISTTETPDPVINDKVKAGKPIVVEFEVIEPGETDSAESGDVSPDTTQNVSTEQPIASEAIHEDTPDSNYELESKALEDFYNRHPECCYASVHYVDNRTIVILSSYESEGIEIQVEEKYQTGLDGAGCYRWDTDRYAWEVIK